jgi:biopolymer transport protein ExbD
MQFTSRKRRQAPAVIIVSLIDVLIVVLIFLVSSTTFKKPPAVELTLPESSQAKAGNAKDHGPLIVDVAKQPPHVYLDTRPVTLPDLQQRLKAHAFNRPDASLTIRADDNAPFGIIIKVMDATKAAGINRVNAITRKPAP